MSNISSFKIAVGMFGTAALVKLLSFALAIDELGVTLSAQAGSLGRPRTTAPASQWLWIKELQAKVEAEGYTVRKATLKKACGEFYTLDKNGKRVELFVDPTNGKIVGQL